MILSKRSKWIILVGLLPALLIYIIFSIVPIAMSFYYSLMSWNGFSDMEFVGFENFSKLFSDKLFWNSIKNNIYVVIASVVGQLSIALFLAILLNRKLKGAKIFRTIGFIPVILSSVVVDRKSTRLNSSHVAISYAVFCLKKKRIHYDP